MESTGFLGTLLTAFSTGGIFMWFIAITFALTLAIAFERFVRLFLQYHVDGNSFMFEVQKYVLANDLDGAIRLCNGAGKAVLPRVMKAGLQRASRDEQQIQNAIDAASLEVIPKLENRLPYLALFANVATLFGLLGTIFGLIKAFEAVAKADPQQKQAILSAGISEAMYATGFGLVTAIIAMILHTVYSGRANRIIEQIDEFGVKLLDLLVARKYKHTSERSE